METAKYAPAVFKGLNGVFCVYKPPRKSIGTIFWTIRKALSKELNELPCRPLRKRVVFSETGNSVSTLPDLSDHPLVVGARYQPEYIDLSFLHKLPDVASGVQVVGIGLKKGILKGIARANLLRVYHIQGLLGRATQDGTIYSNTIEQTTFKHVTQAKLDRVLAAMQAGHVKNAFHSMNIDQQSQEAYELAAQGLIRPMHADGGSIIYGMKCISFKPPNFTLEIHCCNESVDFLAALVHEIGIEVRSSATCEQIRRLRYGDFTLTHALLQKHWNSEYITQNIEFCSPLVQDIKKTERFRKNIQKSETKLSQKIKEGENGEHMELPEEFNR